MCHDVAALDRNEFHYVQNDTDNATPDVSRIIKRSRQRPKMAPYAYVINIYTGFGFLHVARFY